MINVARAGLFTLIAFLSIHPVLANDYYISPNGGTGSGAIDDPWSLNYANSQLRSGQRAFLREGIYRTPIVPLNSGNSDNQRIIYQSYPGERPIIDLGKPIIGKWIRYQGTDGVDAVYRIATKCSSGSIAQDRFEIAGPKVILWNRGKIPTRHTPTTTDPNELQPAEFFYDNGYTYMMTIQADNPNNHEMRCLSSLAGINIQNKQYITVDGIVVRNARRGLHIRDNSNHIIIENSQFEYAAWRGGNIENGIHHIIVRNNVFKGGGSIAGHGGGTLSIFDMRNSLIENNRLIYGGHHCVKMDSSKHNIITGNEVNNCWGKGFTISTSDYNTIEHNKITDAAPRSRLTRLHEVDHHGMEFAGQNDIIRFNVFWGNPTGIGLTSYEAPVKNITIYNNTFVENHTTTFKYGGGISINWKTTHLLFDNVSIINNLFLNNSASQGASQLGFGPYLDLKAAHILIQNNLIYSSKPGAGSKLIDAHYSVNNFETNYPFVANGNMQENPKLVPYDAKNPNFSLPIGSPAIDAGHFLTKTTTAGTGRVIAIQDARYFSDGRDIALGDEIIVGLNKVRIINVNYATNEITVDNTITWNKGDNVGLVYDGSAPDIGAYEGAFLALPQAPRNVTIHFN